MRITAAIAVMGIAGFFLVLLVPFSGLETAKTMLETVQAGSATVVSYLWLILPVAAAGAVFTPVRWLAALIAGVNLLLYADSLRGLAVASSMLPNGNMFSLWGLYGAGFWFVLAWMAGLLGLAVYYWRK